MTRVSENVTRWADEIQHAREEEDISAVKASDPVVMAFLHIESAGDPKAHRPGSQFWGALQMGHYAGLDVGLPDDGWDTTKLLHGDIQMAIRLFLQYMERYEARHDWQPTRMAVNWKGGPGTARTVTNLTKAGVGLENAIAQAEERHSIHNLQEYVRRFQAALQAYAVWLDEENAAVGVCSPRLLTGGRDE